MSYEATNTNDKVFYSVFDASFRRRVPEGTPNAITRVNKKGVQVSELETNALFGLIENVAIEDSDYGKQVKITLDKNNDGKHPILSFGVESKNGRDILKKLPSVDFSKEVRVLPYRFTSEETGDEMSGISLTQPDENGDFKVKVENFFFDPVGKKYLHDFPTIDWDSATEAEQKIYRIHRDEFLVKYVQENVVSKFQNVSTSVEYPSEEIRAEDVGF